MDATDIILTILTGARPTLLEQTLTSVERHLPGLLAAAEVHVLVNGGDQPTSDVVAKHRHTSWQVTTHLGSIVTIGQATSWCAAQASDSSRPLWLHLEDDWEAHPGTLDLAMRILTENPDVSQVRLCLASKRRSTSNALTRRPLTWQDHEGWRYSPDHHLTQTPFLMRASDAKDAYPAKGEPEAMKHWRENGHRGVAQLVPGIFTHLGGSDSLKRRLRSPR